MATATSRVVRRRRIAAVKAEIEGMTGNSTVVAVEMS